MKLKLNLSRPDGSTADLSVTLDADCTVGALADRIAHSDPQRGANPVGPNQTLVRGEHAAAVWTTDFSYDYVRINAEYRS